MDLRVDACLVEPAGAAGGKHGIFRLHGLEFAGVRIDEYGSDGTRPSLIGQEFHRHAMFIYRNIAAFELGSQRQAHIAGCIGTAARRAALRVMVCLITDVLSERIVRKRHAERRQVSERKRRERRLHQSDVSVNGTAARKVLRHQKRRIGLRAVHAELVVSLLVASRVD